MPYVFPLHLSGCSQDSDRRNTEAEHASTFLLGGILFFTHAEIEVGSTVKFTIRMPGETLGAAEDVLVQCDGRVVRTAQEGSGRIVAVAIDEYRFERQ